MLQPDSPLFLLNTLTHSKEEFVPADGRNVKMYCCGPTVYNYAHIGNLRTYLFEDLLRRILEWKGWSVEHVVNITDVGHMTSDADAGEDKMMAAAAREQKSPWEIARFYEDAFVNDLNLLKIKIPKVLCRATDHVQEMIKLIQLLELKGYTYRTSEGIYFDTARDADYGKLAGLDLAGQREGARDDVNVDPEKKHPADFILWFTNKPNHIMKWESPWGTGYPGWHIECSAMSMRYLGDTLDIHCGGIDHIPVHNTNEIAQSESVSGKIFARFWVHGAFLNVKGSTGPGHAKMAKSGDNFITMARLAERGYDPLVYRYFAFNAHYRSELSFSWDALDAARTTLHRIYRLAAAPETRSKVEIDALAEEVQAALLDDLNAPRAIGLLHEARSFELWKKFDPILGLEFEKNGEAFTSTVEAPSEILRLAKSREKARQEKDWARADEIRKQIDEAGYAVADTLNSWKVTAKSGM
jgi:cysteinyl-tRNA synthetase